MVAITFQEELEKKIRKKLKLRINDNRSTMLSVKWEPDCTRVSMHRMFLQAPKNVMDELTCYIGKKNQPLPIAVKAFMEDGIKRLDYSSRLDSRKLHSQGNTHNLRELYDQVNHEYFNDKLNLNITWFGKAGARRRNHITFGLYSDPLKLIKIHRLLDNPNFPEYVVSFIIYHEMLHHIYPVYVDDSGRRQVHNREFKQKEKQFKHYKLANQWIKKNQPSLFNGVL